MVCRLFDTITIARMLVGRPVREALAAIPFFSGLDPEAMERLGATMRTARIYEDARLAKPVKSCS